MACPLRLTELLRLWCTGQDRVNQLIKEASQTHKPALSDDEDYVMSNESYLHFRAKDCRRRTGLMVAKGCVYLFLAVRCMQAVTNFWRMFIQPMIEAMRRIRFYSMSQKTCHQTQINHVIANFPQSVPVKEFWKEVNVWRRYGQKFDDMFMTHSDSSSLSILQLFKVLTIYVVFVQVSCVFRLCSCFLSSILGIL